MEAPHFLNFAKNIPHATLNLYAKHGKPPEPPEHQAGQQPALLQ